MKENPSQDKSNTPQQTNKPNYLKKRSFLIIIFLILLSVTFYFYNGSRQNHPPVSTKDSHDFLFKTVQNKTLHIQTSTNHIQIQEFQGKIVFLKVFGWNCQYCQKEIPELIKLKEKFKSAFNTLAIEDQNHTYQENLDFIQKFHINYDIIEGNKQQRFLTYLKQVYHWNGVIPLTIVIDANGKILAFEVGYKSYSLTTLLQTTLKQLTQTALPNE